MNTVSPTSSQLKTGATAGLSSSAARSIHENTAGRASSGTQRTLGARAAGFTLVELLVVIGIIAVLVALTIPVVHRVRVTAKNGAIGFEIGQLDMAVKTYKGDRGDYPPDFACLQSRNPLVKNAAQALVLRHFATAFPQYVPGQPSGSPQAAWGTWVGLEADIQAGWHIDIGGTLSNANVAPAVPSPSTALVFFLGGRPEWFTNSSGKPILPNGTNGFFDRNKPIRSLLGFGANPVDPFEASGTTSSRIRPAYDFDIPSLGWLSFTNGTGTCAGLVYWPKDQGVTDKTTGPIVYFRAENNNYTVDGNPISPPVPVDIIATFVKCEFNNNSTDVNKNPSSVWPAVDTRLSNFDLMNKYDGSRNYPAYTWINPQSFQIFTSGLDQKYASPYAGRVSSVITCTMYPTGESYYVNPATNASPYDDITNFSNGTLDTAMRASP